MALLATVQQGCAGGLALGPVTEGQLLLSFPGGCAGSWAPLHLGTFSADGASEVSSALPPHNAASSPGLILWGQGCVFCAEPEVGQGSCPQIWMSRVPWALGSESLCTWGWEHEPGIGAASCYTSA